MLSRDVAAREIPLRVLVIDPDESTATLLEQGLRHQSHVIGALAVPDLSAASEEIRRSEPNTIFLDPLRLGIDEASRFVFNIREKYSEITFVLFMDFEVAEKQRGELYRGQRQRFSHYFKLDKRTPANAFEDELGAVILACQEDSKWRMSERNLNRLLELAKQLNAPEGWNGVKLISEVGGLFEQLHGGRRSNRSTANVPTVFVSYRFAEEDYIHGLKMLLEQNGFEVVTGKSTNTFVSKAVLDRIKASDSFLCLMTKDKEKADGTFTTSSWLLEEKGAALAFGKRIVLMVEEGVTDFGGLQGDWQRIHFGPKGFLSAALEAVTQLKSYSGMGGAQPSAVNPPSGLSTAGEAT